MSIARLFLVPLLPVLIASLGGCSREESSAARPGPTEGLTPEQKIEKIQNDPSVPDGLKQIQTDTIRRQSGLRP